MVKVRDEPVEDGLPFSVRLRNDNLRLRNLLNPPQFESSLLGEPGIMFVWNEDQIIFIQGNTPGMLNAAAVRIRSSLLSFIKRIRIHSLLIAA